MCANQTAPTGAITITLPFNQERGARLCCGRDTPTLEVTTASAIFYPFIHSKDIIMTDKKLTWRANIIILQRRTTSLRRTTIFRQQRS